jgi:ankyrin repeat protein
MDELYRYWFLSQIRIAAGQGHLEVIKRLLDNGANEAIINNANETPYDVAVRCGKLTAANLLVNESGACC